MIEVKRTLKVTGGVKCNSAANQCKTCITGNKKSYAGQIYKQRPFKITTQKSNSMISSKIKSKSIAALNLMNYGTESSSPLSDGEGKRGQPR